MNRIDRLFGILTMLQSKKYVTAEKISEKFGISVRTVYRDVKALDEQGIPVSFEPAKGYYIVDGFFLPPVTFTADEANSLLLMETIVTAFTDKSIRKHYSNALGKVKAVMRNGQKEKLESLGEKIKMHIPACFNLGDYEYLSVVQGAIAGHSVIEIEYRNKKEEKSKRRLEPIGLIFYGLAWHLIGWCHMRNEYRDFKISRILRIVDMEIPFTRKHISLDKYIEELEVEAWAYNGAAETWSEAVH